MSTNPRIDTPSLRVPVLPETICGPVRFSYRFDLEEPMRCALANTLVFSFFRDAIGYGEPRISNRFAASFHSWSVGDVHVVDIDLDTGLYNWVAMLRERTWSPRTPLAGMFVNCGSLAVIRECKWSHP